MNMLDTYYFKNKKQTEKMLNENRAKLTNWFLFEMQKYQNAEKNFDQWFTEYTGQSFDEMLKEQGDYITAYADEEDELLSKKIDAQYYEENKK